MTLGRLLLAWLPVAVWFTGTTALISRRIESPEASTPLTTSWARVAGRASVEALLLTLLTSLWFDSLGAGEWWLPLGLVGALVAMTRTPRGVVWFLADLGRYGGAGLVLAWRLRT